MMTDVTYQSPWAFVLLGLSSGLVVSCSLHYVFAYVGVSKWFAGRYIGG